MRIILIARPFKAFLDVSLHLYKRVGPLVGPLVVLSVGPSVGYQFAKINKNG